MVKWGSEPGSSKSWSDTNHYTYTLLLWCMYIFRWIHKSHFLTSRPVWKKLRSCSAAVTTWHFFKTQVRTYTYMHNHKLLFTPLRQLPPHQETSAIQKRTLNSLPPVPSKFLRYLFPVGGNWEALCDCFGIRCQMCLVGPFKCGRQQMWQVAKPEQTGHLIASCGLVGHSLPVHALVCSICSCSLLYWSNKETCCCNYQSLLCVGY